ncbi:MAG: hypothetical protein U9O94_02630 [Nanoarchaeota archaeon]|nr:hypothetical protein [Nanoarchaeota archaeon]
MDLGITAEDLREAKQRNFDLTDGYHYEIVITEVKQRDNKDYTVVTTIVDCKEDKDQNGMIYNMFFSNKFKTNWVELFKLFFTEEELVSQQVTPNNILSKKFSCLAVKGKPNDKGKCFINRWDMTSLSGHGLGDSSVPDFSNENETEVTEKEMTDSVEKSEAELLKEAREDQAKEDQAKIGERENNGLF